MSKGKQMISAHPLNRWKIRRQQNLFLIVIAIVVVLYGAVRLGVAPPQFMMIVAIVVVLSPVVVWRGIRATYDLWLNPVTAVYDIGLAYHDRRRTGFWHWETITDVRALWAVNPSSGQYGIYVDNRRVLVINDRFIRDDDIMNRVLTEVLACRHYDVALEGGKTLGTGALKLDREGLRLKSRRIPWQEVQAVRFSPNDTRIQIDRPNRRPVRMNTRGVPEAPLLMRFISQSLSGMSRVRLETARQMGLESRLMKRQPGFQMVLSLAGICAGLVVIVPGTINAVQYHFIDAGWGVTAVAALIIPVFSLLTLWREGRLLLGNPRYFAADDGLHRYSRSGEDLWRWTDFTAATIVKVFQGFNKVRVGYAFEIDGHTAALIDDSFIQYRDLGEAALQHHADTVYPQFRKLFDRGEPLVFGPVSADRQGLTFKTVSYSWNDVAGSQIRPVGNETHLVVTGESTKDLFATTVFGLPNLYVLIKLIDDRVADQSLQPTRPPGPFGKVQPAEPPL